MRDVEVNKLFKKYLSGQCTAEEKAWLESWYLQHEQVGLRSLTPDQLEEIYQSSLPLRDRAPRHLTRIRTRWAAAAMLLLVLSGLAIVWLNTSDQEGTPLAQLTDAQDIGPGGNRAMLTFSDGRSVHLDESQEGVRMAGTEIVYLDGSPVRDGEAVNVDQITVSTPVGGEYRLVLSDGSTVRLNAETSLTYPVKFTGERRVSLQGEAFFDVTKDESDAASPNPFIVQTNGQLIRVLGTQFNVSAYPDDPAERTTLVEGAVDVQSKATLTAVRILPGEQAIVTEKDVITQIANVDQVIAWTNGYFWFENEPLSSVLAQLSKWYGVEFQYDNRFTTDKLYGMIDRDKRLSQVLHVLESTNVVKFLVNDKTIYVHAHGN